MTKKKASTSLADATAALDEIEAAIRDLTARRTKLLIAGDDRALDAIDAELDRLRKAAARGADRIAVLEEQARQEEVEAVAKRRAALVERFIRKLEAADSVADELQDTIKKADTLFRKVIALRHECLLAFPVGHSSHVRALSSAPDGAALTGGAIKILLAWELYRIGGRPALGGRPGEVLEQSFPGGICERMEWALQKDRLTPFADRLRQGSRAAVEVMKTAGVILTADLAETIAPAPAATPAPASEPQLTTPAPAAVVPASAATNGGAMPADAQGSEIIPQPVRTEAQVRLGALLARQAVLSEGPFDDANEREYQANLAAIVAVTDEIEQLKG